MSNKQTGRQHCPNAWTVRLKNFQPITYLGAFPSTEFDQCLQLSDTDLFQSIQSSVNPDPDEIDEEIAQSNFHSK